MCAGCKGLFCARAMAASEALREAAAAAAGAALHPPREVAHALAVMAVAGAALVAYKLANPGRQVDRFYQENSRAAYRALRASYFVLVAAVAFSGRFVAARSLRWAWAALRRRPRGARP